MNFLVYKFRKNDHKLVMQMRDISNVVLVQNTGRIKINIYICTNRVNKFNSIRDSSLPNV